MKARSSSTCTIFHIKMKLQNLNIQFFFLSPTLSHSLGGEYYTKHSQNAIRVHKHLNSLKTHTHTSSSIPESPKIISLKKKL